MNKIKKIRKQKMPNQKNINPGIKFTLSMMTLVFLLYTGSKVVFIFNLILFNLLLLLNKARTLATLVVR